MRVLVAFEASGIVRDAFIEAGHDATSCDILPTERPGPHIHGDARPALLREWDLIIAHPPCNALSQYSWQWKNHLRFSGFWERFALGIDLFIAAYCGNAPLIAIENPPSMNPPAKELLGEPSFRTDFANFGDPVRKRLGFWTVGLPPLISTGINPNAAALVRDMTWAGTKWPEKVGKGSSKGLSVNAHDRAAFQPGIARAMAEQWGAQSA